MNLVIASFLLTTIFALGCSPFQGKNPNRNSSQNRSQGLVLSRLNLESQKDSSALAQPRNSGTTPDVQDPSYLDLRGTLSSSQNYSALNIMDTSIWPKTKRMIPNLTASTTLSYKNREATSKCIRHEGYKKMRSKEGSLKRDEIEKMDIKELLMWMESMDDRFTEFYLKLGMDLQDVSDVEAGIQIIESRSTAMEGVEENVKSLLKAGFQEKLEQEAQLFRKLSKKEWMAILLNNKFFSRAPDTARGQLRDLKRWEYVTKVYLNAQDILDTAYRQLNEAQTPAEFIDRLESAVFNEDRLPSLYSGLRSWLTLYMVQRLGALANQKDKAMIAVDIAKGKESGFVPTNANQNVWYSKKTGQSFFKDLQTYKGRHDSTVSSWINEMYDTVIVPFNTISIVEGHSVSVYENGLRDFLKKVYEAKSMEEIESALSDEQGKWSLLSQGSAAYFTFIAMGLAFERWGSQLFEGSNLEKRQIEFYTQVLNSLPVEFNTVNERERNLRMLLVNTVDLVQLDWLRRSMILPVSRDLQCPNFANTTSNLLPWNYLLQNQRLIRYSAEENCQKAELTEVKIREEAVALFDSMAQVHLERKFNFQDILKAVSKFQLDELTAKECQVWAEKAPPGLRFFTVDAPEEK